MLTAGRPSFADESEMVQAEVGRDDGAEVEREGEEEEEEVEQSERTLPNE
jgi:hypothetical protein